MIRGRFGLWGFYVYVTGRPASWIVSIVFIVVGFLIAFFLPSAFRSGQDATVAGLLVRVLGGVFLVLGLLILCWMLADLYLSIKNPDIREAWYWWGNFLVGLLAAGLFAVPSTLAFPVILLFYLTRPNGLFPAGSTDPLNNLGVGFLFSLLGLLSLAMILLIARPLYAQRPRRGQPGD